MKLAKKTAFFYLYIYWLKLNESFKPELEIALTFADSLFKDYVIFVTQINL